MKFLLFLEDRAERHAIADYLRRWLDQKLSTRVGIDPVQFNGKSDYRLKIKRKVELHLSGSKSSEIIACIGLIDLHTLSDDLPVLRSVSTIAGQAQRAREQLERQVDHARFFQHIAVHEIESWLLSSPQAFPNILQAQVHAYSKDPEGVRESPASLIARLYWDRLRQKYKKSSDGVELLSKADPQDGYDRCPHLRALLDHMLLLANAGSR